jgi:hypothetical protein
MNKFNKTLGKSFTTPKIEKLSKIKSFLENLSSEEPIFLEVQKLKDIRSKKLECFFNVELFEKQGIGSKQLGWIIWYDLYDRLVKAEAHCVLKTQDNELIDVTPQEDGEEYICFVPDNTLIDDGQVILDRFEILENTKEVNLYVEQQKRFGEIHKFKYNLERQKLQNEPRRVEKKQGRNELCACGSGKKYKKCCGK